MRWRQTALNPWFRLFAAGTIWVWVAALILCRAHCSLGVNYDNAPQASCHGSGAAKSRPDDGDTSHSSAPGSTMPCLVLKAALVNNNDTAFVAPDLHPFFTSASVSLALDAIEIERSGASPGRACPRDWVLTPEVSLGPAFRAHAPPQLFTV